MLYRRRRTAIAAAGDVAEYERITRECVALVADDPISQRILKAELADIIHARRPQDPETLGLLTLDSGWATTLDPRSPRAAWRLMLVATVLIDRGKYDEAEPILKVVNDFVHSRTIPGNYFVGWADSLQGAWLAVKGEPDEAELLLIAGLENLRKSRGDHHPLTHEACDRLVNFYKQAGREAEATHYDELLIASTPQPAGE